MAESNEQAKQRPQNQALESYCFQVGRRPFCVWGIGLRAKNVDYLQRMTPEYFEYLAQAFIDHLDGENKQHAALALRVSYGQALEALFALLCAAVQAPGCVAGWMVKYQNKELEELVSCIHRHEPIPVAECLDSVSWATISGLVHMFVPAQLRSDKRVAEQFGELWSSLAAEFLQREARDEYHSIKHGLRAKSGGFRLSFGVESTPGVPAPRDSMKVLVASDFGSMFPYTVPIQGDVCNLFLRDRSRNWTPQDIAKALALIANSIRNVVAYLMIRNGQPPQEQSFSWPADPDEFSSPWRTTLAVNDLSFSVDPPDAQIPIKTRDEILQQCRVKSSPTDRPL